MAWSILLGELVRGGRRSVYDQCLTVIFYHTLSGEVD
jgi:hypothetical protein